MACCQPITRGMRTAPCTVGTPSCTSGKAKLARSEAITKSAAATMVSPKPMAGPLTAAITGFHTSIPPSSDSPQADSQNVRPAMPVAPPGSFRSAPAQRGALPGDDADPGLVIVAEAGPGGVEVGGAQLGVGPRCGPRAGCS